MTVGEKYSTTKHVNEYRKQANFLTIEANIDPASSYGSVNILGVTITEINSRPELNRAFKSMLGDVFDLYQSDLAELRESLAVTTILGVTRIECETGEVVDLGMHSPKVINPTNDVEIEALQQTQNFVISDNNPMDIRFEEEFQLEKYL